MSDQKAYNKAYYLAHLEEMKASHRAYRQAHLEEIKTSQRAYRQVHPEKVKAYHKVYRLTHWEKIKAYRQAHREDRRAYLKAYRVLHLEKEKTRKKAYYLAHPEEMKAKDRKRKALKRGAAIGTVDYEFIKTRDRTRCQICHKKVKPSELSFDHIIPLSQGGPHITSNIQVAHLHCNIARGNRLAAQTRLEL